jgi:hypothetical protein
MLGVVVVAVLAVCSVGLDATTAASEVEQGESSYYDVIGIGWSAAAEGGPRFVWRVDVPGIDPVESTRIFRYLEGPDIEACMAAIIDSSPTLRSELAKMGPGTVCGGSPEVISRVRALWTSFGLLEALTEVAHDGRRGERVATLLGRCDALRATSHPQGGSVH